MSKQYKILRNHEDIELNGKIFYIPDKFLEHKYFPLEHKKLYKYIIALLLDNYISKTPETDCKLSKTRLSGLITIADKIIAYLTTGKIYINTSQLTNLEKDIINRIPDSIVNQINILITEKLDS
jgi:predicted membrane-bound dolichyl-phosphate-mannose-protein mannosyltransferase